jgi:MoxR-like ATPase
MVEAVKEITQITFKTNFFTPAEQAAINKCQTIMAKLREVFVEREEIIEAEFINALCKQHMILIGPPGTAKSAVIECFCKSMTGWKYFAWQLTKYSVPEELFGPYSLAALKNDQFLRKIDGKLPQAHIVYIDEVFNANSSILNALNSSMNERTFEGKNIPLQSLYGATNFQPEDSILVAFFDRFLFRFIIEDIHESRNFEYMLQSVPFTLSPDEMLTEAEITLLQNKVPQIKIDYLFPMIAQLRGLLKIEQIEPSSRRFKWALSALQACALLNGHEKVIDEDLFILKNILWTDKKEIPIVESVIAKTINPAMAEIKNLMQQAVDIQKQLRTADRKNPNELAKIMESLEKLGKISDEIDRIKRNNNLGVKVEDVANKIIGQIQMINNSILKDKLNIRTNP